MWRPTCRWAWHRRLGTVSGNGNRCARRSRSSAHTSLRLALQHVQVELGGKHTLGTTVHLAQLTLTRGLLLRPSVWAWRSTAYASAGSSCRHSASLCRTCRTAWLWVLPYNLQQGGRGAHRSQPVAAAQGRPRCTCPRLTSPWRGAFSSAAAGRAPTAAMPATTAARVARRLAGEAPSAAARSPAAAASGGRRRCEGAGLPVAGSWEACTEFAVRLPDVWAGRVGRSEAQREEQQALMVVEAPVPSWACWKVCDCAVQLVAGRYRPVVAAVVTHCCKCWLESNRVWGRAPCHLAALILQSGLTGCHRRALQAWNPDRGGPPQLRGRFELLHRKSAITS